jgi:penicillin-binding protein 1A
VLHRGVSQGGSTITQQLAKNLFLTPQRSVWRKLQEVVLALWIERKFSKNEILELYLNRVYFGSGAYGVEAAAQRYFGKPAHEVKLAEAAMLAGLVKSPSRLAPSRNPDGAERRAQIVLAAMAEAEFITETMAKTAMAQPAHAVKPVGAGTVGYVADWIMDVLDDLVGHLDEDLRVETTIDPALQAAAEKALVDELAQKGQKFDVEQGALVAMTPDGGVRAMVGGRNPVQPRGGGQASAGLRLQAVRVSDRARARAHARHGARGQADRAERLEAGELRPPIPRTGHVGAGLGNVAQYRVGSLDA